MDERTKQLVEADRQAMDENMAQLDNLDPLEACPHQSADSVNIGDGDTEHTCNACGYNWITSDPRYHE